VRVKLPGNLEKPLVHPFAVLRRGRKQVAEKGRKFALRWLR
jgi:hypothetical protein